MKQEKKWKDHVRSILAEYEPDGFRNRSPKVALPSRRVLVVKRSGEMRKYDLYIRPLRPILKTSKRSGVKIVMREFMLSKHSYKKHAWRTID